jgi:hypothetical protein
MAIFTDTSINRSSIAYREAGKGGVHEKKLSIGRGRRSILHVQLKYGV